MTDLSFQIGDKIWLDSVGNITGGLNKNNKNKNSKLRKRSGDGYCAVSALSLSVLSSEQKSILGSSGIPVYLPSKYCLRILFFSPILLL